MSGPHSLPGQTDRRMDPNPSESRLSSLPLRLGARVHHLGAWLMRGERGSEGREGSERGDGTSKLAEWDVGMKGIKGRGESGM